MTALTEYPPVGTRVRWTSRGNGRQRTKEGLVSTLAWEDAAPALCSFVFWLPFYEAGGETLDQRRGMVVPVVEVDTVDGQGRRRGPRYYRPRPHWLEVLETKP